MKKNTQVQLLIAYFKEFLLRVIPNTNGTTAVNNFQNHHFITTSSLQQFWLNFVDSLYCFVELMKCSINLSHQAQ